MSLIQLSTRNFYEASKITGNDEFSFIIGDEKITCHKFVASFLSKSITQILLSDPTVETFNIDLGNSNNSEDKRQKAEKVKAYLRHLKFQCYIGPIFIWCIYYSTESSIPTPTPEPFPTTLIPISIGLYQMTKHGNFDCNKNLENAGYGPQYYDCNYRKLDHPSAYQCGIRCWGNFFTLEYSFKGVKFAIYGAFDPNYGKFRIIINDLEPIYVDEHNDDKQLFQIVYESEELPYGNYNIKIEGIGDTYEIYKLAFWPTLKAIRLNSSDLTKTGDWIIESDGIGGSRHYTHEINATASKQIQSSKFWVYGTKCSWHSNMTVTFGNLSEIIDEYDNSHNRQVDSVLVFESPFLPNINDTLFFKASNTVMIYCVYYYDDALYKQPTPSESPIATPSESPIVLPTESSIETLSESPIVLPTESPIAKPAESPVASYFESNIDQSSTDSSFESFAYLPSELSITSPLDSSMNSLLHTSFDSPSEILFDLSLYSSTDLLLKSANSEVFESSSYLSTIINYSHISDILIYFTNAPSNKKNVSPATIGIIIAVITLILIVVLVIFLILFLRKRNRKENTKNDNNNLEMPHDKETVTSRSSITDSSDTDINFWL